MTTLNVYTIEKPTWKQVSESHVEKISKEITNGGWIKDNNLRHGFLNCETVDGIVYGYFAQEGNLRIEQYDDYQIESQNKEESFERLLFLLFLRSGVIVVQSIRISRYIDLSGPKVRSKLFDTLEMVFRKSGLVFDGKAKFEKYTQLYTKSQLLQIFEDNIITRIVVSELQNKKVPEDIKLFNPDFKADDFLKAIIEEDINNSETVDWEGDNVQETKIPRALMYAGEPKLIVGIDKSGGIREWENESTEKIEIDLSTTRVHFPKEDLKRLLVYIQRKFGGFKERIEIISEEDTDNLPLFNQ